MRSNDFKELVKNTVRDLRRRQTPAEKMFWEYVRNRRFMGKKFLRQHPIVFEYLGEKRFFVADFYCAEKKLIVEIDGGVHELQEDYDELRTAVLNLLGFNVIRFKNEEVKNKDLIERRLEFILGEE